MESSNKSENINQSTVEPNPPGETSPAFKIISTIIQQHHNNLHQVEAKLKELLQNQAVLVEGLKKENERFKEAETTFNLPALFQEVSTYNQKLTYLRGEMVNITERTARLKRRSLRLQQQQEKKALEYEQQKALLAEHEKHLIARPVWDPHDKPQ